MGTVATSLSGLSADADRRPIPKSNGIRLHLLDDVLGIAPLISAA